MGVQIFLLDKQHLFAYNDISFREFYPIKTT